MRRLALAAALALGIAPAAHAVTFDFVGTGQTIVVTNNDVVGALNGQTINMITGDRKTALNGLRITGPGILTYTYLGYEAANRNHAVIGTPPAPGGTEFRARPPGAGGSAVGDSFTTTQTMAGLVRFLFSTTHPVRSNSTFANDGAATATTRLPSDFAIGYWRLSDTSYYLLFDDISRNDRDFDDLVMRVDVAIIPLPAGGVLLLTALGGLALAARRRRAAAA